jgi:hypothetical protein
MNLDIQHFLTRWDGFDAFNASDGLRTVNRRLTISSTTESLGGNAYKSRSIIYWTIADSSEFVNFCELAEISRREGLPANR